MPDEAPELLHLLKAGRILQYRQQNVALISAPEGTEFDITYAARWLAPGAHVRVGDGAVVVLSDSPYDRVDPVRYATVTGAEHSKAGLQVRIRVGPWPVVEDDAALAPPLKSHPTRPPYFVWWGPADGLRPPRSDHEAREGWRHAVGRLEGNPFYEESNFARLVRVLDPHGHDVRERSLELGEVATAMIEVLTPGREHEVHSVLLDSDPPGTVVGGIEKEPVDAERHLHVPVRPLAAGTHRVDLSFVPEPLLSTRISFDIDAHRPTAPVAPPAVSPAEPPATAPLAPGSAGGADPVQVQALAERLRRLDAIDGNEWLTLLQDHILPLSPDDPVVRSITAEAAFELEEWETVVRLLDDPARFRTGDAFRALGAGLHYGLPTDVAGLLRQVDLGVDANVARLAGELPRFPDGAVHQIVEVILDEVAGKEVLDRLLPPVFARLRDDLALRVAKECAAADPDAWLDRSLARWPDPHRMPDEALDEILGWDVTTPALGPYLRESIEHHVDAGDIDAVLDLDERARALLPRLEQVRLRAATARLFFEHDDTLDTGRGLLLAAVAEAAGLGDPDLSAELAFTLRERWPAGEDDTIDTAVDRLRAVLDDLAEFQEWRTRRDLDTADRLRARTEGRVVHVVGGRRPAWAEELAAGLGLRALRWHEGDRSTPPALDWAGSTETTDDPVVLVWTHCGHATTRALEAAGVRFHPAPWTRAGILAALDRAVTEVPVA